MRRSPFGARALRGFSSVFYAAATADDADRASPRGAGGRGRRACGSLRCAHARGPPRRTSDTCGWTWLPPWVSPRGACLPRPRSAPHSRQLGPALHAPRRPSRAPRAAAGSRSSRRLLAARGRGEPISMAPGISPLDHRPMRGGGRGAHGVCGRRCCWCSGGGGAHCGRLSLDLGRRQQPRLRRGWSRGERVFEAPLLGGRGARSVGPRKRVERARSPLCQALSVFAHWKGGAPRQTRPLPIAGRVWPSA